MFRRRRSVDTTEAVPPPVPEAPPSLSGVEAIEGALPCAERGLRHGRRLLCPVRVGECAVHANPAVAQLLGIRSIPALVVFGPHGS